MSKFPLIGKTPSESQRFIEEKTILTDSIPTITLPQGSKSKISENVLTDVFIMTPEERNQQFINLKKNQTRKITEARKLKDSQIEIDKQNEEKEIAELKKAADKYDRVLQGRKLSKLTTNRLTSLGGKRKTKKNKNKRSRKNKKQNKRLTRHR
jgi:hypothetical protein